jgi:hypothetical protein
MRDRGVLCPEADPEELASALLAMLLGGILLGEDQAGCRSAAVRGHRHDGPGPVADS